MRSKINIADEIEFYIEALRIQLYKIRNKDPFVFNICFPDDGFGINNVAGRYSTYGSNNLLED